MDPYRPPDDLDLENPYAPPRSTFAPDPKPDLNFLSIPFTIDSIVSTTWSIFRDNLWPCIWVVWSVLLIEIGIRLMFEMLLRALVAAMPGDSASFLALSYALIGLIIIFQVWLEIGRTRGLIKIVRGEPVTADVIFSGGPYLLRVVLAGILLGLLFLAIFFIPLFLMGVAIAMLRNQMAAGIVTVIAVSAICLFLMIYLGARFMQFYYLIIEREAGVIESIQLSWQITRGRAGTIILVYLVQLMFLLAGLLALCVGLVFTAPLSTLLLVVAYLAMIGAAKPADRMPITHWEEDV